MAGGCSSWRKRFTMSFGEHRGVEPRAAIPGQVSCPAICGTGHLDPMLRIINTVQTLQVDVGHSRYPISIGSGLLMNRELLEARVRGRDLLIVTNTTVARLYLAALTDSLAGKRVSECILPDGERHKTLQTAGLAEVIKYGCVWDSLLFDWLDDNIPQLLARDVDALSYSIARSCEIKATVVARDEREQGLRAILNFGHTFGHAIEAATAYETYLHGEAVGLGMLIAADLSHRLGLIDSGIRERVREILRKSGLPTDAPRIGAARALDLMHMDKKVLAGTVRLVLLQKLGRAIVTGDYTQAALDATVAEYFA